MVLLNLLSATASATAASRVRDVEVPAHDKPESKQIESASCSRTGYDLGTAGSLRAIGKPFVRL